MSLGVWLQIYTITLHVVYAAGHLLRSGNIAKSKAPQPSLKKLRGRISGFGALRLHLDHVRHEQVEFSSVHEKRKGKIKRAALLLKAADMLDERSSGVSSALRSLSSIPEPFPLEDSGLKLLPSQSATALLVLPS